MPGTSGSDFQYDIGRANIFHNLTSISPREAPSTDDGRRGTVYVSVGERDSRAFEKIAKKYRAINLSVVSDPTQLKELSRVWKRNYY